MLNFRQIMLFGVLAAALLLAAAPRAALAWGPDGHEIVAGIAELRLTPAARAALDGILQGKKLTDYDIASWPDLVRGDREIEAKYPGNAHWHFVDFDISKWYDEKFHLELPEDGNDIVDQIERWRKVLADASQPRETRLDALRFVVHFCGDVHEPMHCAQRYGDMGGNMLRVNSFAGQFVAFDPEAPGDYGNTLHSVWDKALVGEVEAGHSMRAITRRLNAEVSNRQATHWVQAAPFDWASEAYWVARKVAYRFTGGERIPYRWTAPGMDLTRENYIDEAVPCVREQLKKGGIRLAYVLNCALDPDFAEVEAAAARPVPPEEAEAPKP